MQISHWKIAASNCIHVDLNPAAKWATLPIFVKKWYIYLPLFQPSVSVSWNPCSLRSVMVLDIDSTVAGSSFGSYQTVWLGRVWADEQHSVGFPSCQLHLGCCCQGHNLKCRWHSSRQHSIYQWAPDYSWLSYIIIPSNLIVKRPGKWGGHSL